MYKGVAVYDQSFHEGVNIIRGENGSGKSTIADFIFYVLGGDFSDWKVAANKCDEVQAEVGTKNGKLCLRRSVQSSQSPIRVFFGDFKKASESGMDGWEHFPLKRQNTEESFSQLMFRSIGLPEAKGEGASNITMHQLLRLLYSDQKTPANRLFRFDTWDNQTTREAVGELICGIKAYDAYEIEIKLRELDKDFDALQSTLKSLFKVQSSDESIRTPESINSRINDLREKRKILLEDIRNVDNLVDSTETKQFIRERKSARKDIEKLVTKLSALDAELEVSRAESIEISHYLEYLQGLEEKIAYTDDVASTIGQIEFSHCPACLNELASETETGKCNICGSTTDIEAEKSKYNQIQLDIRIQIRESNQLLSQKNSEIANGTRIHRRSVREYEKLQSEFSLNFDLSSSPREAFLARKNLEIGQIEGEIEFLNRNLEIAEEIQRISKEKASLQEQISSLKDTRAAVNSKTQSRRKLALSSISNIAVDLLAQDVERQAEFASAELVELNFKSDSFSVDNVMNFAESSNVFLKNTVILSMLLAAGVDEEFFHPKFLLFDNIEDKGMEEVRSHKFQELLVKYATEIPSPYQVIYTTSMMNPALELDDYIIGPPYTHKSRTLNFSSQI